MNYIFRLSLILGVVLPNVWSLSIGTNDITQNVTRAIVFEADFSQSTLSAAFGGAPINWGSANVNLWGSGGGMDVVYPAGTFGSDGGFGLYSQHQVHTSTVVLTYSVYFPEDFNFVKGGKLPGLYGGKANCAGGDPAKDCFSLRMMWRSEGRGEVYLYANRDAQDPAICQMPNNHCNEDFGWSLDRGAFTFARGAWTDIEIKIVLNTPGSRNGQLAIKINGNEIIAYDTIVFRIPEFSNMKCDGIHAATFFGGSNSDWAPPTKQTTKFRGFRLENGLNG